MRSIQKNNTTSPRWHYAGAGVYQIIPLPMEHPVAEKIVELPYKKRHVFEPEAGDTPIVQQINHWATMANALTMEIDRVKRSDKPYLRRKLKAVLAAHEKLHELRWVLEFDELA